MLISVNVPASRAAITAMLEGLTVLDMVLMSAHPGRFPPLYESGIRYRREPDGRERWLTAPEMLAVGFADCEDISAWRAAELRLAGVPAKAVAIRTGKRRFHGIVLLPDKTFEDPSVRLGMPKPRRRN